METDALRARATWHALGAVALAVVVGTLLGLSRYFGAGSTVLMRVVDISVVPKLYWRAVDDRWQRNVKLISRSRR